MEDELKYLIDHGIIDLPYVKQMVEMDKRQRLLENHPFKIWFGARDYWYTTVVGANKKRIQIKRRSREQLEKAIVDYYIAAEEDPTFDDIFFDWNERRLALGKITESSYLRYKQTYARHFQTFGKKRIKHTSEWDIVEFLEDELARCKLTAKGFGSLKETMRGILKRAKRKQLVKYSISGMFESLEVSGRDFNKRFKTDEELVFDEYETNQMVGFLKEHFDLKNAGILLMFVTGIRVGELVSLKHDDLNPYNGTISVHRTETRAIGEDRKPIITVKDFPKTERGIRNVVLPNQFKWLLMKLYKASENQEWVFLNDSGTRCTTNQIRKRLKQNCDKLEIVRKSPHKIRATYDTILMDAKVDNRLVMDQMGHTDIRVDELHYHRNRKDLEKKAEIISGIKEFCFGQAKTIAEQEA